MGIAVLLKQVPDTTAKITVSGGRVDEAAVSKWSFSPYDEYALESALQIKEAGGGDLIAVTCGPARAAKMLTDAAAVGADALLIEVHPNPAEALSDNAQQITLDCFKKLMREIRPFIKAAGRS